MKKLIVLLLVVVMGTSLLTTKSSAAFHDVKKNHSHYAAINWAVQLGILKGYQDGSFKPEGPLTEAQFMRIFARYLHPFIENEQTELSTIDHIYAYMMEQHVYVAGTTNKQVRAQTFTRLDVAKAFAAADLGKAKVTSKEAIDWMYANQITTGKGVSSDKYVDFGSNDPLKRAHIAAFFKRLSDHNIIQPMNGAGEAYSKAKTFAPKGYELADLKAVQLHKTPNGKKTYFVMYLEPGQNAFPYYGLLQYDARTKKWTMPILELNEGYRYEQLHTLHVASDETIAEDVLLLINWEGTGGFIVVYSLGIDEIGNYHLSSYGGYADGDFRLTTDGIKLYEYGTLMETLTWFDGELVAY